jgi:hypothetical protein
MAELPADSGPHPRGARKRNGMLRRNNRIAKQHPAFGNVATRFREAATG